MTTLDLTVLLPHACHRAPQAGMGRALGCTPTSEIRAKLAADGVADLTEEEINALSKDFNEKLQLSAYAKNKAVHSWFGLFNEVDKDGSGMITYAASHVAVNLPLNKPPRPIADPPSSPPPASWDEFTDVARKHLKIKKKELPDARLRGLWCALDADDSNQLQRDEFSKFLKRSAPAVHKNVHKKDAAKASTFGAFITGNALACTPTRDMRAALLEPSLTESELLDLSELFKHKLEESLEKQSYKGAKGIGNLFADVDADGSGFITYDEFEPAVRKKLHIKKGRLSNDRLKALWCAIDGDDSNQIHVNEFSMFVKGLIRELLDAARQRPAIPSSRRPPKPLPDPSDYDGHKSLYQLANGSDEERAIYAGFLAERARERAKEHAKHEAELQVNAPPPPRWSHRESTEQGEARQTMSRCFGADCLLIARALLMATDREF